MLWVSAILILGSVATFVVALGPSPELPMIKDQVIHARVPWVILGSVWIGLALGVAAMIRRRSVLRWIAFVPLVAVAAGASGFLLKLSYLPESTLRVAVGDPFPGFDLPDQDEAVHSRVIGAPRPPELYLAHWYTSCAVCRTERRLVQPNWDLNVS